MIGGRFSSFIKQWRDKTLSSQDIFFWGMMVLTLVAVILAIHRTSVKNNYSERTKKDVAKTLRSMAPLREWKVLEDVSVTDRKGRRFTVDQLVVGPFGVLALTDIHRRGGYYGELRDEEWVISTGGEDKVETLRVKVPSPVKNNERFVAAFREKLTAAEIYNIQVEALCPITQSQIQVFVTGAAGMVVENGRLREVLSRPKYQKDNGVDIGKITALLEGK